MHKYFTGMQLFMLSVLNWGVVWAVTDITTALTIFVIQAVVGFSFGVVMALLGVTKNQLD
jgi:hypothetical protein